MLICKCSKSIQRGALDESHGTHVNIVSIDNLFLGQMHFDSKHVFSGRLSTFSQLTLSLPLSFSFFANTD